MTHIEVVLGDITEQAVDAVVNAANSALAGGGGVDGALHRAAGPSLMAECRQIGGCPAGEAVVTAAGLLPCRWVIHTVGPIWDEHRGAEHDLTLASAYRASLDRALEVGAREVAFPNISTGVYGFPKERAASTATSSVAQWVDGHPGALDLIRYVCFDRENLGLYLALGVPEGVGSSDG